ncbi:nucleotidyltransferase family protein [Micromonospora sp. NPDC000089]|uniref:nucleotidyltransferase family protein n=1 Tax=unclassified Micromonospora TaxID=2617518 RepID=UPI0036A24B28
MTGGPGAAPAGVSQAARCLALDSAAVAACAALAAHHVPALLLKGPGLSRRLGVLGRAYGDIDLLVAPGSFDRAQQVLAEHGCHSPLADDPAGYERPWKLPGPVTLTIDLHRGFHGVGDREAFWAALHASAEPLPLAGGAVRVPGRTAAALLVALHAAVPGNSAKPRADLVRALAVFPPDTWVAAARLADRVDAAAVFAVGLRCVPAGVELAATLALTREATAVSWLRARRGSSTALGLARLAELPTTVARLRQLTRGLYPPADVMRYNFPLAHRGSAGMLAARVVRMGRHAGGMPRALVELRTAARRIAEDTGA